MSDAIFEREGLKVAPSTDGVVFCVTQGILACAVCNLSLDHVRALVARLGAHVAERDRRTGVMSEDEKLVRRVDEHGEGLTDWEADFVESCLKRVVEEKRPLSEAQRVRLRQIDEDRVR